MYLQFFALNEAPFSITPDPAFVYLSAAHRDALAHLLYGVGQGGAGGFVQLTGEVGTGKTTLCRCLMEQIPPETQVALVLNPLQTPRELLASICQELGLDTKGQENSSKAMVDMLNGYLLDQHASGRRVVVVIDEAQNLSPDALEQVRLLTNLETAKEKLLQMVLLGQPELRDLLQRQSLRQLAQRITARYHLTPLDQEETFAYVRHRMMVAGARIIPFRKSALRALYQRSGGVPRLINIIADRALAGAYARETANVSAALVHAAANEVQPSEKRVKSSAWPQLVATASVVALLLVTGLTWGPELVNRFGPQTRPDFQQAKAEPLTPEAATKVPEEEIMSLTDIAEPAVGATSPLPEAPQATEQLAADWLAGQDRYVWQDLAGLWRDRGAANAIQSACSGVPGTGYSCVTEYGNWSRIHQLGLPVVLVLAGAENRLLLFRGFNGSNLLLGSGNQPLQATRDAVERHWLGEYMIAWPQAPDWPGEIQRGETGVAVEIVMEMATFAQPSWSGPGVFDSGFESWLRTFQQQHGLKADGIIGPSTLIHLMAPTIGEPRLILSLEENS